MPETIRQVDRGHPTLTDLTLDVVATFEGSVQAGDGIRVAHALKMRRRSAGRETLLRSDAPVGRHLKRQTRLDPAAWRIHNTSEECAVRGYAVRAGSRRVQGTCIGITDANALIVEPIYGVPTGSVEGDRFQDQEGPAGRPPPAKP